MAFYVLLYDTFCITVPTIWIDFERSTFQMPKNSKQLTQACIKKWSPCDDWDEVKFQKSFGPYETYQNARSVEKAISDMSASDDNIIRQTQTNNTVKKRFIKKRKFYGDTSSNEDEPEKNKITMPSNYIPPTESGYVSDSASQPTNKLLTSAKSVFEGWLDVTTQDVADSCDEDSYNEELQYCNTEMQKTMPHDGCDEQENKKSSKEMPQANISVKQKIEKAAQPLSHERSRARPTILSDVRICPSTSNSIREIHVMHRVNSVEDITNNKENLEIQSINLQHTSCCEKCRRGYSSKFATLERKLNRIIHFLENPKEVQNEVRQVDFSLLPNFPLTTVEQVEAFNNQLEDDNVRRQFIEKMSQVGGETVPKIVRNIMSQIIGYEVAQAYTWTGQKKKLSLKKSKLSDSLIGIHNILFNIICVLCL